MYSQIILFKYADDKNGNEVDQSPKVVDSFSCWSVENSISCNPRKCKEFTLRKKGFVEEMCKIHNIPQCSELRLLGVIFQYNNIVNTLVTCAKSLLRLINACT